MNAAAEWNLLLTWKFELSMVVEPSWERIRNQEMGFNEQRRRAKVKNEETPYSFGCQEHFPGLCV